MSTVASLLMGFAVFIVLYLILTPTMGAINQVDIANLRSMFGGMGVVSKAVAFPLKFMEKCLRQRGQKNK